MNKYIFMLNFSLPDRNADPELLRLQKLYRK